MAFIEKEDPVVLNIMLTSKGREQLSAGALTFSYFVVGDSEIDYNFIREISGQTDPTYKPFDSSIIRPKDKNPQIISFIPRNITGTTGSTTGNSFNVLSTISPISYEVVNTASPVGFFTDGGTTFITDSNHVKQPDAMVHMSGVTGGTILKLRQAPAYGVSALEPLVGDYVLVKWALVSHTTGYTVTKDVPTPYLMYQITSISGSLAANTLSVGVDRELPNFLGYTPIVNAGALIYSSGITTSNQFGTDYLSESTLNFLQNYQCGIDNFPFWKMSIVFTEEIAGIQIDDRKFGQFNSRAYGGFVSYIQNQAPLYKKLGIIHYTNNSPANTYGEEFYNNTPTLDIPTIMWHKSSGATLGTKLKAFGNKKLLTGSTKSLNIDYYDLADALGNVVGKVFNGLKIFVIEDQELLFAMSYKSNRSWTLPNYIVGGGSSLCPSCPIYSTLYFGSVDSFYNALLTLENGNGQVQTVRFAYTLNAYVEDAYIDGGINSSITELKYSIDGGNIWVSVYTLTASVADGEQYGHAEDSQTYSGTFTIPNIYDMSQVRIKLTYENYIDGFITKTGSGFVIIDSVTVDNGNCTIACDNKFDGENLSCTI